jgi:hypothetical protein
MGSLAGFFLDVKRNFCVLLFPERLQEPVACQDDTLSLHGEAEFI